MKKFLLTIGFFLLPAVILAATLSPEEALSRYSRSGGSRIAAKSTPELRRTVNTADGNAALYVFSEAADAGFIVLSADDKAPALLGYSDAGEFDAANIPPQLEWWLQCYASQVEWLRNDNAAKPTVNLEKAAAPGDFDAITPMVKTKWNQMDPYNILCPKLSNELCPTGCVATAMAQVMKYFNYPKIGTGEIRYLWKNRNSWLSMKFSEKEFDWENMADEYIAGQYTEQQADAVAYLMQACGYASQMNYGLSASSASAQNQALGMVNYFGYDKGMTYVMRQSYNYDDWFRMIYDNLVEYGPIIYGGNDIWMGGHSFVCDGYDGNGYFHFNWGWSGMSDGYFLLDALAPYAQGVGGNVGGYNFVQDALLKICPAVEGSSMAPGPNLTQLGNLNGIIEDGQLLLAPEDPDYWGLLGYFNFNYLPANVSLGVTIEGLSNTSFTPLWIASENYSEEVFNPLNGIQIGFNDNREPLIIDLSETALPDGDYKVTVSILNLEDENKEIIPTLTVLGFNNYVVLSKNGDEMTVRKIVRADLTLTEFKLLTDLYYNTPALGEVTFVNNSDEQLTRGVAIQAYDIENKLLFETNGNVITLDPGESLTSTLEINFYSLTNSGVYSPLTLSLAVYDPITDLVYKDIIVETVMKPTPQAPRLDLEMTIGNGILENGVYKVNESREMDLQLSLTLNSGYFGYPLFVSVWSDDKDMELLDIAQMTGLINLEPGDSYNDTFKYAYENAQNETTYYLYLMYYNGVKYEYIYPEIAFSYGASGVEAISKDTGMMLRKEGRGTYRISVPGGISNVEVYNLTGTRLGTSVTADGNSALLRFENAVNGTVIVRITDAAGYSRVIKLANVD